MTNEILALAESQQQRDQFSKAALEFAEDMDWKSITGRYLNIFSAIRRTS